MLRIGFVGWRGMVGSVLMERMLAEKDFKGYEPVFFHDFERGWKGSGCRARHTPLRMPLTSIFFPRSISRSPARAAITLRRSTLNCGRKGWRGYWWTQPPRCAWKKTASSCSIPLNRKVIDEGLERRDQNLLWVGIAR